MKVLAVVAVVCDGDPESVIDQVAAGLGIQKAAGTLGSAATFDLAAMENDGIARELRALGLDDVARSVREIQRPTKP